MRDLEAAEGDDLGRELARVCVAAKLPAAYVAIALETTRLTVFHWFRGRQIRAKTRPAVQAFINLVERDLAEGMLPARTVPAAKTYVEKMLSKHSAIARKTIQEDEPADHQFKSNAGLGSELEDALLQLDSLQVDKHHNAARATAATLSYADGSKYEGALREGRPHGPGALSFADGRHFAGVFFEGKIAGRGEMTYPDGRILKGRWDPPGLLESGCLRLSSEEEYDGFFLNGKPHGYGRKKWARGGAYSGEWNNGKFHGFGVYDAPDGNRFVGNWYFGSRVGYGEMVWKDGDTYQGEWLDNKPNGTGTLRKRGRFTYSGQFLNGKRHGFGICSEDNDDKYEGLWLNGTRSGPGVMVFANGSTFRGLFSDDKPVHGEIIFANGDCFIGSLSSDSAEESSRLTLASGSFYEGKWSAHGPDPSGIIHHETSNLVYLELLEATLKLENLRVTEWEQQSAQWSAYLSQRDRAAISDATRGKIANGRAKFIRDADIAICAFEDSIEENEPYLLQSTQIHDLLSCSAEQRTALLESFLHQTLLLRSRALHRAALAEIQVSSAAFQKLFEVSPWALLGRKK